jgi:hypothetical protein
MFLDKDRTMDNVQKYNICTKFVGLHVYKKACSPFLIKAFLILLLKSFILDHNRSI